MTDQDRKKQSIDELISKALDSDEKEFLEHYDNDPSFFKFLAANLRGKMGWIGWISFILIDIHLILGIWFGYCAFQAVEVRETVLWSAGVIICFGNIGMLKMWVWIEASRRSTLRELKRLELQVARVAEQNQ